MLYSCTHVAPLGVKGLKGRITPDVHRAPEVNAEPDWDHSVRFRDGV